MRVSDAESTTKMGLFGRKSSASSEAYPVEGKAKGGDDVHLNNGTALKTSLPDAKGYFGDDAKYGGAFLPPPLEPVMQAVGEAYAKIKTDPEFLAELSRLRKEFIGRPSPIMHCKNLSDEIGGAQIYLKREDLNHTGSHKINHCLGEVLLAKKMGKSKVIAETGAGQHGTALAAAAALLKLKCEIHMGELDIKKEWPNVRRMQVLGATVVPATAGGKSLKEAVDSAFGAFMGDPENMLFAIGSTVGPHPYPMMVRDFQSIVGYEAKRQFQEMTGAQPDYLLACVGGGCNSLGLFTAFLDDASVKMIGVEPAGHGLDKGLGQHSATLTLGTDSVIHGMSTICLVDDKGEPAPVHSCASGLDYPGIGPQHAFMKKNGRVQYETATDEEVIDAFFKLSRLEGIIPALESAHGLAHAMKIAKTLPKTTKLLVNMSGRGDKDLDYVCDLHGEKYGIGKEGIFASAPKNVS
jgi:tryptophan synthase beta chain